MYANVSFTDGNVDGEGGGQHAGDSVGTRGGGGQQLSMPHDGVQGERESWSHLISIGLDSRRLFNPLFLGGEVNLIGVVSTISSLLAGTSTSGSRATGTAVVGLHVLGRGPVAGALAGGTGTAGATGTGHGVLLGRLVARAVQSRLLAAGALGLLGTDTGVALAAAGGRLGNFGGHC